ncbi:hypothetical protein RUM44_012221 [Polyplax serrata]|uniref:Uncharacterized protein n=1 Tax=Polyplax serrata TaxID=468196 RepID=A0ABR1BAP9_POLSC
MLRCEILKPKKTIGCSDDGTQEKEEHDEEAEEKKSNTTNKKTRTESYETTADIKNLITVGETFITESILRSANFFTDENLFFSGGQSVGHGGMRNGGLLDQYRESQDVALWETSSIKTMTETISLGRKYSHG